MKNREEERRERDKKQKVKFNTTDGRCKSLRTCKYFLVGKSEGTRRHVSGGDRKEGI